MFFPSIKKKVQTLRLEFEDIRQRVVNKYDGYERLCFWQSYSELNTKIWSESGHTLDATPPEVWLKFRKKLRDNAKKFYLEGRRHGGNIMGQELSASANAAALASVKCGSFAFSSSEADMLRKDISAFEILGQQSLEA